MFRFILFKKNKIEEIVKEIPDIKKQQLLAEVRLLRIESYIAIIAIVGAFLSFTILNYQKIINIFRHSKVKIQTSENDIYKHGKVIVSKINDGKPKKIIICKAKEMQNFIDIEPGSYNLKLEWKNQLWSTDFLLTSNEAEVITVPEGVFALGNNKIHVTVTNNTPRLFSGEMLELLINVTGNGYIWCYELLDQSKFSRIYPKKNLLKYNNIIKVDKPFRFPDENGFAIFAGDKEKEETLIVLVTSEKNELLADEIINKVTKTRVTKAKTERLFNNWGIAKTVYSVIKP